MKPNSKNLKRHVSLYFINSFNLDISQEKLILIALNEKVMRYLRVDKSKLSHFPFWLSFHIFYKSFF